MNRRLSTIAFLAGATVFNLVLLFFFFLGFSGVASIFVPMRSGAVAIAFWVALFLLSLMATWFTYRWALALIRERFPLDRYLDPRIFKGRL